MDSQAGLEDPAALDGYEQLEATWLEHGPAPVQEIVASIILGPGEWDGWFAKWAALDPGGMDHAFRCLVGRDDITGRLGEITCPALVLHGTSDAAIPISRAEELRDGLAGPAELVRIEGGPHAASLTHPDPVNAAVIAFLRGLGSS